MAAVNTKTSILKKATGAAALKAAQDAGLKSRGWRIKLPDPIADNSETLVRQGQPGTTDTLGSQVYAPDGIVWEGRPPFPGTRKQMPKYSRDKNLEQDPSASQPRL